MRPFLWDCRWHLFARQLSRIQLDLNCLRVTIIKQKVWPWIKSAKTSMIKPCFNIQILHDVADKSLNQFRRQSKFVFEWRLSFRTLRRRYREKMLAHLSEFRYFKFTADTTIMMRYKIWTCNLLLVPFLLSVRKCL